MASGASAGAGFTSEDIDNRHGAAMARCSTTAASVAVSQRERCAWEPVDPASCMSVIRFESNERHLGEAPSAQAIEHRHEVTVGNMLVGPQQDPGLG